MSLNRLSRGSTCQCGLLVITVALCGLVFITTTNVIYEEGQIQNSFKRTFTSNSLSGFHHPSSKWIIPNMAPEKGVKNWKPRDENWTVIVSKEFHDVIHCQACFPEPNEDSMLSQFAQSVGSNPNIDKSKVSRKIATLHFLIKRGARTILHSSDLLSIEKSISRFSHDREPYGVSGLEYIGADLKRDSFHYHYRSNVDYNKPCQYRLRRRMKPVWTVGVRCRSTEDKGIPGGTVLTDHQSPPIFSSTPKFDIETFSDSLFQYEGLWAMFASIFSKTSQTRTWAFWAQRMLAEIEGEMAITSLPCPPSRKTTLLQSEPDAATKNVFESVAKWQCEKSQSFFTCALQLGNHLLNASYITQNDVTLLDVWIKALKYANYSEPKRVSKATRKEDVVQFCVFHSPALVTPKQKREPYDFFPNIKPLCSNVIRSNITFNPLVQHTALKPPKTRDIAFISFLFKKEFYDFNIPVIYDLYNQYFPTLVFCGPSYQTFIQMQNKFKKPITFIEVRSEPAYVSEVCMTSAMMMNYDVNGYLQAADDTLVNAWSIGNLPRDQFWFQKDVLVTERSTEYIPDFFLKVTPWKFWRTWNGKYGKNSMENIWKTFDAINSPKNSNVQEKKIVNSFLQTLKSNFGSTQNICYQASDIFYVPTRVRRQWLVLGEIFALNNGFLEIAMPTLMHGIDRADRVYKMLGYYLWYQQRPRYREYYNVSQHFMHPWKLSSAKIAKEAEFLCNVVLPEIVKERTSAA